MNATPIPLVIVVAVAENGVIGRDNELPWRLRTDLRRFKALTWGKPIIMGRRTWDSIGRPLPGREAVVLTRQQGWAAGGARVAHGWEAAKEAAVDLARRMSADAFAVIGGAALFELALPEAERIHLTTVRASPAGDVVFPDFDRSLFREVFRQDHPAGEGDQYPFAFTELVRRPAGQNVDAAGR